MSEKINNILINQNLTALYHSDEIKYLLNIFERKIIIIERAIFIIFCHKDPKKIRQFDCSIRNFIEKPKLISSNEQKIDEKEEDEIKENFNGIECQNNNKAKLKKKIENIQEMAKLPSSVNKKYKIDNTKDLKENLLEKEKENNIEGNINKNLNLELSNTFKRLLSELNNFNFKSNNPSNKKSDNSPIPPPTTTTKLNELEKDKKSQTDENRFLNFLYNQHYKEKRDKNLKVFDSFTSTSKYFESFYFEGKEKQNQDIKKFNENLILDYKNIFETKAEEKEGEIAKEKEKLNSILKEKDKVYSKLKDLFEKQNKKINEYINSNKPEKNNKDLISFFLYKDLVLSNFFLNSIVELNSNFCWMPLSEIFISNENNLFELNNLISLYNKLDKK